MNYIFMLNCYMSIKPFFPYHQSIPHCDKVSKIMNAYQDVYLEKYCRIVVADFITKILQKSLY